MGRVIRRRGGGDRHIRRVHKPPRSGHTGHLAHGGARACCTTDCCTLERRLGPLHVPGHHVRHDQSLGSRRQARGAHQRGHEPVQGGPAVAIFSEHDLDDSEFYLHELDRRAGGGAQGDRRPYLLRRQALHD